MLVRNSDLCVLQGSGSLVQVIYACRRTISLLYLSCQLFMYLYRVSRFILTFPKFVAFLLFLQIFSKLAKILIAQETPLTLLFLLQALQNSCTSQCPTQENKNQILRGDKQNKNNHQTQLPHSPVSSKIEGQTEEDDLRSIRIHQRKYITFG